MEAPRRVLDILEGSVCIIRYTPRFEHTVVLELELRRWRVLGNSVREKQHKVAAQSLLIGIGH